MPSPQSDSFSSAAEYVKSLEEPLKAISNRKVTAHVENGNVRATAVSTGQIVDIQISSEALKTLDSSQLSKAVLRVVRGASAKAVSEAVKSLGDLTGSVENR